MLWYALTFHTHAAATQGSTAIVGTDAGEVRMYRLSDGFCELSCTGGHSHGVMALAAAWQVTGAFEGPLAASGARDGSLCVWDLMLDSGQPPIAHLRGHTGAVSALAVRPAIPPQPTCSRPRTAVPHPRTSALPRAEHGVCATAAALTAFALAAHL
jgi:WD40 repeat protein